MASLVGARVRVHGFAARPDLNDQEGLVTAFDVMLGRCAVHFINETLGHNMLIKPIFLATLPRAEHYAGEDGHMFHYTGAADAEHLVRAERSLKRVVRAMHPPAPLQEEDDEPAPLNGTTFLLSLFTIGVA